MTLVGISCVVLLVLTTVIHYEALRMLTVGLPAFGMPARTKLIVVILIDVLRSCRRNSSVRCSDLRARPILWRRYAR